MVYLSDISRSTRTTPAAIVAGTDTTPRAMSPADIKQAVEQLVQTTTVINSITQAQSVSASVNPATFFFS